MKTRDLIMQKTLLLLLRKGFDGVSVSDIKQEVDIARGLLYHYFKSKDELLMAVLTEIVLPLKKMDEEPDREKSISDFISYWLHFCRQITEKLRTEEYPELSVFHIDVLLYQCAQRYPQLRAENHRIQKSCFAAWKAAVLNSFAKGELRTGLNLESLARQFFYLSQPVVPRMNDGGGRESCLYEMERALKDFYEIIKR